jgi:hypothetical protein
MKRGTWLLGAALGALLLVAPAATAVRTEVVHAPAGELRFAGDAVVFVSFDGSKVRLIRQAGGTATVLHEYEASTVGADDDECCQTFLSRDFSVSATRVAVSRFYEAYAKGSLAQSDFTLETGPIGRPLSRLFFCPGNHPFDLDGDRLAYLGDSCTDPGTGPGQRIVIRNLAAEGAPAVFSTGVDGFTAQWLHALRLEGDHLAYGVSQGPPRVVVLEVPANAVRYQVDTFSSNWSLQADGKLALGYGENASGGCRIDWYSKAEPTAHRIDVCPLGALKLVGERIAFMRRDRGAGTDSLDVVTLAGQSRSVVFTDPIGSFGGFDWDGSRLAYGVEGCLEDDDRIYVEDLTGEPPVVEGGECPATIRPKTIRSPRNGLLRFEVACPEGCEGALNLFQGRQMRNTRPGRFEIVPGTGTVRVRLQSGLFRRTRSRVMEARLEVTQRSGTGRVYKRAVRVLAPER